MLPSFVKRHMLVSFTLLMLAIVVILLAYAARPTGVSEQAFGVSFAARQARDLGLDPNVVYQQLLDDLGVRKFRLAAYWDVIEPQPGVYDFEELDWQIQQAQARKAEVVLAVGRKLPRWPECFHPEWIHDLSADAYEQSLLDMVRTVTARYADNPTVVQWQLENEPFVGWFGDCPKPNPDLLRRELAVMREVSQKPVIITDSGELSLWYQAARFADLFGTTMYRVTWNEYWGYGKYPVPAAWYRLRARLLGLDPNNAHIMELQAEPWAPGKALRDTSIDEQLKSMNLLQWDSNVRLARKTGFGSVYLWGAEWWYWMKQNGHPEFWDKAKVLFGK